MRNEVQRGKGGLISAELPAVASRFAGCRRVSNEVFHVYGAAGHEQTTARPRVRRILQAGFQLVEFALAVGSQTGNGGIPPKCHGEDRNGIGEQPPFPTPVLHEGQQDEHGNKTQGKIQQSVKKRTFRDFEDCKRLA